MTACEWCERLHTVIENCDVAQGHREGVYIPSAPGEALFLTGQVWPYTKGSP